MNVPPPSSQPQESASPPEAKVDGKANISQQSQNLVSQEAKEQNKSGDTSLSQQPQAPVQQVEAKVSEGKTDSTQPFQPSQPPVSQSDTKYHMRYKLDYRVIPSQPPVSQSDTKYPPDFFAWIFWILFLIAIVAVPIWMARKSVPDQQVSLPFLSHNMSAYTVITSNDVEMKPVDHSAVMNGIVDNPNNPGYTCCGYSCQ